jgi:ERCC4-type nuclease
MVKILIDDREPSKIIEKAKKVWSDVEVAHLPVGDIVCAENNVCIERKEIMDFVSSVRAKKGQSTGRVFTQVQNMVDNFENNHVIIVGDMKKVAKSRHVRFTTEQYNGAVSSIASRKRIHSVTKELKDKVPVHEVDNVSQFFKRCSAIIRKSDGTEKDLNLVTRSEPSCDDIIAGMISYVPGIGPKKAVAIKDYFDIKKVSELIYISEEQLKEVPGIGFVQSQNFKKFFQ